MKDYYLFYNELTKHYFLDVGAFERNRQDLGVCDKFGILENKLKKVLPCHRKSKLYLNEKFPNQYRESLKNLFKSTQINILFDKDLKQV